MKALTAAGMSCPGSRSVRCAAGLRLTAVGGGIALTRTADTLLRRMPGTSIRGGSASRLWRADYRGIWWVSDRLSFSSDMARRDMRT